MKRLLTDGVTEQSFSFWAVWEVAWGVNVVHHPLDREGDLCCDLWTWSISSMNAKNWHFHRANCSNRIHAVLPVTAVGWDLPHWYSNLSCLHKHLAVVICFNSLKCVLIFVDVFFCILMMIKLFCLMLADVAHTNYTGCIIFNSSPMEFLLLLLVELFAGIMFSDTLDGRENCPLFGRLSLFSFSISDLKGRFDVSYKEIIYLSTRKL